MEESRQQQFTDMVKLRIKNMVLWREADEKERRLIEQSVYCIVSIMLELPDRELKGAQRRITSLESEVEHLQDVLAGANKLFRYLGTLED